MRFILSAKNGRAGTGCRAVSGWGFSRGSLMFRSSLSVLGSLRFILPSFINLIDMQFFEKTRENKLEYLGFDDNSDGDYYDGDGVDELPEYSMSYLKRVTVAYLCEDGLLLGLLRYLLRNSVVLESLVLLTFPHPDIHMKNLVAQVKRYPKISPFAQARVRSPTVWHSGGTGRTPPV
ncbi:hypothetical protein QJS10_CPB13g00541 [Acorus calamus]|uniref:FBD domain-containing protein n=1 Tax=Acorus calamus TaxID=4465 RepID=A0AAV9DFD4_ACOCL|nr:hypothetical protein QJS10_CPB13g00541 [Acorus calamus]